MRLLLQVGRRCRYWRSWWSRRGWSGWRGHWRQAVRLAQRRWRQWPGQYRRRHGRFGRPGYGGNSGNANGGFTVTAAVPVSIGNAGAGGTPVTTLAAERRVATPARPPVALLANVSVEHGTGTGGDGTGGTGSWPQEHPMAGPVATLTVARRAPRPVVPAGRRPGLNGSGGSASSSTGAPPAGQCGHQHDGRLGWRQHPVAWQRRWGRVVAPRRPWRCACRRWWVTGNAAGRRFHYCQWSRPGFTPASVRKRRRGGAGNAGSRCGNGAWVALCAAVVRAVTRSASNGGAGRECGAGGNSTGGTGAANGGAGAAGQNGWS